MTVGQEGPDAASYPRADASIRATTDYIVSAGHSPSIWARLGATLSLKGRPAPLLDDPGDLFWDDLVAANRLKIFLLSSGIEVSAEVVEKLADLTSKYQRQRYLSTLEASGPGVRP